MPYRSNYLKACLDGSHSVFKILSQKEKEILVQHHTYSVYRKGDLILREGEKLHGLITLASGKAKIFKEGVAGRQQILKMIRPQGMIGYRAIFTDGCYSASAQAVEESSVCTFEKEYVLHIIRRNPELSFRFSKILAEELRFSNNRIVSLTQKHIRGRLAESLLVLRDTYGFDADGKTINICLSREDLANLSNMTTSNAIRTLSNLAAEDVITLEGRMILILNGKKLEKISELG